VKRIYFILALSILIIGFLFVYFVYFTQENSATYTYTSSAGFSLTFPPDWEVNNSPSTLNPYLMMLGQDSEAQVEVTLEYYNYSSLEDFFEKVKEEVSQFPGVKIISQGEESINGAPSYWFTYSFLASIGPSDPQEPFQAILYLFSQGGNFFRIICLTKEDRFNDYLNTFQTIARSFTTLTEN